MVTRLHAPLTPPTASPLHVATTTTVSPPLSPPPSPRHRHLHSTKGAFASRVTAPKGVWLWTSSDSSADALSDSASSLPSVHHSSTISERPSHDSSSASRSRKRSRLPVASVPLSSPTLEALSYAHADLLPSPKRIRSLETATDLEVYSEDRFEPNVPREVRLGVEFEDESSEPSGSRGDDLEMDVDVVRSDKIEIDPEIQAEIHECFTYADALRDRKIDARVVVEAADREESETGTRGPVEVRVEKVMHPVMREDTPKIVGAETAVTILTERVTELERDNKRLIGTVDVESQRVDRLQRGMTRIQRELRQIRRDGRVAGALRVRDAVRNLRPLMGDKVEQEEVEGNGNRGNGDGGNRNRGNGDGGNGNGGNRNGNGNGGEYGYNFRGFMPARECTYQDFLKCQPLNFNGTEGVVGLTRWFEKMETVFHISNCPEKYQVKYASCTLLNSALTWWNSHKRTIGNEAAYAMSWAELMKLMTEELILLCTRMVPNEEDRVERFIGGLPDNIQGNVIAANPARFQDAVRIANQLMDKKLQGYAARSAESKRRMESNSRDNRGQQPPFKRQNISGQNVVRAYTTGNNKRRGYTGPHPLCNKCKYHHVGPCTVKCNNCKKVGHLTRDCTTTITLNTQRALVGNQQGVVCYECGRPGHFRKDCPKLRNQNRRNQTRNRVGNKTGNQTGGNEATAKAYAIGGGGTNPDSNIVTGTFLLNNCYASMLFDLGTDRSFVSSTFSALLDITPSTLDTSYIVELADGRIS
ncbi:putative reverse transcriptase domain-containing protein [Tanacetum coccineum]